MMADDLILFSQVVELGSFSKVAEQNGLTNSVVSKRISRLEKHLNTQLLHRTTRKLSLTEAGRKLAVGANTIKQATIDAVADVTNDNDKLTGHIKMSVPTISGDLLLATAVTEFCSHHPHLSVDMSLDNRFVDPVEEGVDLVIRTGHLEDSSLIARHIIDSQWVVCASPRYLEQHGSPKTPVDLANHNCFSYVRQVAGGNNWQFRSVFETYTVQISGSFSTDNAAALRKAALSGFGIVYVPKCLVHLDVVNGCLITLFGTQVAKNLGVYAIHPFVKKTPRKVSLLIDHIKSAYLQKAQFFSDN
ncbi:LysR family transcriptional regulator [Echinimonas agarilytica]|uniref:LysR family transcriptional regulator n=1 Tax=Echinimonas agarilytica TaxID=1215918 RepID=A0AA41W9L9_9GAMM|nr:LysR family transcriptional regulator [Echinimonas agarilytica]MCM2680684.1 LysR family transcriptional regulator [Echinimonas agarilytica]